MGRTLVATGAATLLALGLGLRLLLGRIGGAAWGGLESVVSYSSKMIAASRAVESQEEHPLVADPLAEKLAGAAAVASSRRRAPAAPSGSERKFKVGKMAIRTRWFDDQIEAALGMPVSGTIPAALRSPSGPSRVDLPSYVWTHPSGHEPRQLVMLGAGMDSRPWRMKLPADLRWFEVDRADVVAAKQAVLKELAAEVPAEEEEAPSTPPSGLSRHLSIDKVDHPLRCGHWAAVAADLSDPSWADALLAAGFDPSRPTVWVAEGLLMYLEKETVQALFARAASLSAAGSVFVALSVTEAVIERAQERKAARKGADGGNLMDTWVFGCPTDPTAFLAASGWRLRLATDRGQQAAALGIAPELCGFPPFAASATANGSSKGDSGSSLFLVATPAGAEAEA